MPKNDPHTPPLVASGITEPAVRKFSDAGYKIIAQNDGVDYWALYRRFAANEIPSEQLKNHSRWRDVFLVERDSKKYVIKHDRSGWGFGGESGFERMFWKILRGPFYSRLFRRALSAEKNGCDRFQKIFLVAEKRIFHYCKEAIIIMEYIEGPTLRDAGDIAPMLPAIAACLSSLHAHNLALCDLAAHNFILTENGIKAIDLSCRGNRHIDAIKDTIRAKRAWGMELPVNGAFKRCLHRCLNFYYSLRHSCFGYKSKKIPLRRHKYFKK